MKDEELVELWGQNLESLFESFAENQWQPPRWQHNWKTRKLLPKQIRTFIEKELNHERQEGGKKIP